MAGCLAVPLTSLPTLPLQLISAVPSAILVLVVFTEETLPSVIRRREGFDSTAVAVGKPGWHRLRSALGISAIRPLGACGDEPLKPT